MGRKQSEQMAEASGCDRALRLWLRWQREGAGHLGMDVARRVIERQREAKELQCKQSKAD